MRNHERGAVALKFIIFLLVAAGAAGGWYVYQQKKTAETSTQQYLTTEVKRGAIAYTINASGSVHPFKVVEVGAQVSGEISTLSVEIGDVVAKGDLIAEIDARTQENDKKTAEAQLQSYQATLATAKSNLTEAQQAYNRADRLYKTGAGTQEDHESAYASLMSAKNAVTEANANIRKSELTIENAEVDLGYTRVTAPIAGTVIAVAVEEGQTVNATQSTPTLVTLAQTDVMTIKAEIAEADVSATRPGLPVRFSLLGKNDQSYTGKLKSIDPAPMEISDNGSLGDSDAIYYYGDIDVENPENRLRYGMTAKVAIQVEQADDALIIPMTAISDLPDGSSVVHVLGKNNQPEARPITIGIEDGVNAQVLGGVKEGEAVIISTNTGDSNSFMRGRGMF